MAEAEGGGQREEQKDAAPRGAERRQKLGKVVGRRVEKVLKKRDKKFSGLGNCLEGKGNTHVPRSAS